MASTVVMLCKPRPDQQIELKISLLPPVMHSAIGILSLWFNNLCVSRYEDAKVGYMWECFQYAEKSNLATNYCHGSEGKLDINNSTKAILCLFLAYSFLQAINRFVWNVFRVLKCCNNFISGSSLRMQAGWHCSSIGSPCFTRKSQHLECLGSIKSWMLPSAWVVNTLTELVGFWQRKNHVRRLGLMTFVVVSWRFCPCWANQFCWFKLHSRFLTTSQLCKEVGLYAANEFEILILVIMVFRIMYYTLKRNSKENNSHVDLLSSKGFIVLYYWLYLRGSHKYERKASNESCIRI